MGTVVRVEQLFREHALTHGATPGTPLGRAVGRVLGRLTTRDGTMLEIDYPSPIEGRPTFATMVPDTTLFVIWQWEGDDVIFVEALVDLNAPFEPTRGE